MLNTLKNYRSETNCTCGCCLDIDHPGQAYCPFCDIILYWIDDDGWMTGEEIKANLEGKIMTYNFTIIIASPINEDTIVDDLYNHGCDDCLFSVSNSIYELEFDREFDSLEGAVISAICNVKDAGLQVLRVYI